jgi:hypothetical protein
MSGKFKISPLRNCLVWIQYWIFLKFHSGHCSYTDSSTIGMDENTRRTLSHVHFFFMCIYIVTKLLSPGRSRFVTFHFQFQSPKLAAAIIPQGGLISRSYTIISFQLNASFLPLLRTINCLFSPRTFAFLDVENLFPTDSIFRHFVWICPSR